MGEKTLADETKKLFELLVRGLDEYVRSAGDSGSFFRPFRQNVFAHYFRIFRRLDTDGSRHGSCRRRGHLPRFSINVPCSFSDCARAHSPKLRHRLRLFPNGSAPRLKSRGIVVDISPFDKFLYEQFIAYYALTAATERVYVLSLVRRRRGCSERSIRPLPCSLSERGHYCAGVRCGKNLPRPSVKDKSR